MHILFLTDNFPPEVNAPASRTFEHCREWVKRGHQVTVITCAPNFPGGRVFEGYRNRLWQSEDMCGIRVIRVWSYITANKGTFKRIADYLSYMLSAILAGPWVRRVDIVIGTSPQFFTVCAAYAVSALKRVPFVFELRDLWPESIKVVGAMRDSLVIRWLERLELFLYRRADVIVSVTNAFKEHLISRGIDRDKITVITNGVDITRFSPTEKNAELARRLGLEGKFVAGYVGTQGMAHALDTLLEAAAILEQREAAGRYRIVLLGDGAAKDELKRRATKMGLHNVLFLDTVAKEEVPRYWSLLDVSIVHLKKTALFNSVIPSKIFESMGMGIPILLGVDGEAAEIVRGEQAGLVFEAENAVALSQGIIRLAGDEALREELGLNAVRAAHRYDRVNLAERMLEVLTRLI